jgi:hypothetical protein
MELFGKLLRTNAPSAVIVGSEAWSLDARLSSRTGHG